jgi:long-chain acyl-CoA synthetase
MSRTLWSVLEATASKYPDKIALKQPGGDGSYRSWTWREYADTVKEIAVGLRELGISKGDMVALASETRAEFYLADLGVLAAGAIAAALYTSLPYIEQAKTLIACDARYVFVENEKVRQALDAAIGNTREFEWILLKGHSPFPTLDKIQAMGAEKLKRDPQAFTRIAQSFDDSATAVLYMTSGATGEPKMGLVTHHAIVRNIEMGPIVLPLSPEDTTIAFLPSAHIAQRVVVEYLPILEGACVVFSEGLQKLPREFKSVKPTFVLAPPRVWERVFASISAEIKKRPAAIRKLFYSGVGIGAEAARLREQDKPVPAWMRAALGFFNSVIFSKILERLGGRIRIAASGAAPLGKDLSEFYSAIGLPLIEGYGLTEGGVAMLNPIGRPKAGSIGTLLPCYEARIEEDGELMLKSPCLFSGYYKDPEATAAVLRDGWLATGDIAQEDSEGYFYITGRKKEIIVASNGKKIYPAHIEALLKREPSISQVLLIGDKLPFVTALFTVNVSPQDAQESVSKIVKQTNRELSGFEQIRKFKILDRDFSIDRGELTPTMKLRRAKVLENHRDLIQEMYSGREID